MSDGILNHRRILVVEDEYMIADEFCLELKEAGAVVIGPTATVEDTLSVIATEPVLDAAILDVNLGGTMTYAAADRLMADSIPFVFATGYDVSSIPRRFDHVPRCEKPISMADVIRAIEQAMLS